MTALKLLAELRQQGITMWVEKDQLRYQAPKNALTPTLRTQITEQKPELLDLLRKSNDQGKGLPLVSIARTGPLPLSFAQQRMWLLHQLEPDSPAYNMRLSLQLEGKLDVEALEQSFQTLVHRHETLRTCFPAADGQPSQVVRDSLIIPFDRHDLRELLKGEREAIVRQIVQKESLKPFDLARGPVIRATLIQLGDDLHVLLITMHHIVTDAWSRGIFRKELTTLYRAFTALEPSHLPELPIQYVDYAHWQRQWMTGGVLEAHLAYWRRQLASLSVLQLPTDHPRPPMQTHNGASYTCQLSTSLRDSLQALSRKEGVTWATTLLAAFQVLLARYTSQEDIVVGSPIANRNQMEIEGLIGFFANTLVLRTNLSGDPGFREVLRRVHQVALGAQEYQDLPFERLVEELHPERDRSRNPLFQVMFAVQNAPTESFNLPGITVQSFGTSTETTRFDLECHVWANQAGLCIYFVYNTDLFERDTIVRLGQYFQRVLEAVVQNPSQRLSQLPLLSEADQHQVLIEWNNTRQACSPNQGVHHLEEAQAKQTPNSVAVTYEGEHCTYGELNKRANQLANYLRRLGVGPEVLVGLCVNRSLDMVIGLLGILKAGGGFVPMDPAYPAERLHFMLKETRARVVVTHTSLSAQLSETSAHIVCLDRECAAITQEQTENLDSEVTAEHLAYVIFTSGSTGNPKGVALCHRTLTNLISWQAKSQRTPKCASTLQFASPSFDVFCQEVFSTWGTGGRLLMIPESTREDFWQLPEILDREGIERVFLPFVALQQLANLAQEQGHVPTSLREVITSGEQLKISDAIVQLINHRPDGVLVNQYGPSESHVVTSYELTNSPDGWPALPPIGRPVDNTQIYLLDVNMRPVPIGAVGELYLGGKGLARGYINRPDLTAERFVPHAFSEELGERLYRTGDHGRYQKDGNIEFLGRIDHQVKLRGYRIELGEIEVVLSQHPAVKETVVQVRETTPGDQRLLAYVVPSPESEKPSGNELRSFLQKILPEYMVPTAFVMMDVLPLTPNGKLDRRALPEPSRTDIGFHNSLIAPRNPTEEMLVEIWQDLLQLPQVGVHDNFFELGGHSLLAMKLLSRVDKLLQREVPLRVLLEVPTIAGLATFIEKASHQGATRERPALKPVSRDSPLPLSLAQRRLWFLDQLEPGSTAYLLSRALRLRGPLNQSAFEHSLNTLITRHESLRTTFDMHEGNPVQVIAPSLTFDLPVVDLQALSPTEQEQAVQEYLQHNARPPFDLTVGPLLRATVLKLSVEEHVFLLTLHHIITDGLSMAILFRELATLYRGRCEGHATTLPLLPIQYADYGAWQHQWLQGEVLEQHVAYWREHLHAPVPVLTLPTDFPRPAVQTHLGASLSGSLSAEMTTALRSLSQQTGTTLFMTVLAALNLVLSRWSGQDDVCVGIPNAGRQHADIEHVIGFFINTLVVRTDLSDDPTFQELLVRVREATLGAYAHQTLPFEKLVEELQPVRDQSRTPFFQVLVNMVPPKEKDLQFHELTVQSLGGKKPQAKFDLTVYLQDRPQGLGINLVYNTDLFLPDRMQHLLAQFQGLIEQIVATPDQPLSTYSLVSPNASTLLPDPSLSLDTPVYEKVPDLIAQWAIQSPLQAAIHQGDQIWSYEEFMTRAQDIGQTLLALGLNKGDVVAISGPSSFGLVASLVGILQCGGVFLLVDPELPVERQDLMRAQGQAVFHLMIAAQPAPVSLDENNNASTSLTIDMHTGHVFHTIWDLADHTPHEWPAFTPGDPAYIFFTSGTTGTPKAILGTHQGLSHFLAWQRETFTIGPDDRVAQLTGLSFDVILRDLFLPLTSGGTLCLPEEADRIDGTSVLRWLQRERITALHTVPTVLQYWLMDTPVDVELSHVRWMFFAGEPLTHHLIHQWRKAFPNSGQQVNLYGPTETSLAKAFYQIPSDLVSGVQPVGHPLPHTQLLVLTPDSRLCGMSELGEIVIRTPFRTLGYLNAAPEHTQRFRQNPFTKEETDVLYWTGDQGRYRLDGTVEILGRLDDQVKVNGVRIEPGEVIQALNSHPQVQISFVSGRRVDQDTTKLVAYVVPIQGETVTTIDLRTFVSRTLIPAMVPSAMVLLNALPRTPNGKVDRTRLPEPEWNGAGNPDSYVAPQTSTEEMLVEIWQGVLKVETIGIHDNFFELGGHSLLATQVVSRIREKLSIDLKLRYFFEMPSIAGLAQALDALSWTRVVDHGQEKPETERKEKGII